VAGLAEVSSQPCLLLLLPALQRLLPALQVLCLLLLPLHLLALHLLQLLQCGQRIGSGRQA
jgi:hypothetical protein